ncbi:hypothetical protein D1816_19675 [Aquimarina sp. AD10]|uniref:STAS/SEC14 domain-containing protein n=1 Tax=Aquimarina aggregata TaxID=1642818 RepID=A0A162CTX3_9FLAO|nr:MULTISPECIES: hypothetical protein [Aquimarina]AXT62487.1 hypothetical protein D1816_19675 [Aquimarina sp. AD10]KZS40989.1 hypothetical protein AWE51_23850 [Aquimarina aggregata]RKM90321.1 hypothetical protein D7033_22735 [Aquimarina sp. AD10]
MKETQLSYCHLTFKESHAILVMYEGSAITIENAKEITALLDEFYQGRKFVFITHRKYGHDIDLDVYKGKILKNMIGFAIVSNNPDEVERAVKEQSLWNEAFTFFTTLEEAENWASSFFD